MKTFKITKAEYLAGYKIQLWFNNGEVRVADFSNSTDGPIFEPLKDIQYFKKFTIPYNTLEWSNGADFAPEYLYAISAPL